MNEGAAALETMRKKNIKHSASRQQKKKKRNEPENEHNMGTCMHCFCDGFKSCQTCCMRDTTPILGGMFF